MTRKNSTEYGFPVPRDYIPPASDVRDLAPRNGESHQSTQARRRQISEEMRAMYPEGAVATAAAANKAIASAGIKNPTSSDVNTFRIPSIDQ